MMQTSRLFCCALRCSVLSLGLAFQSTVLLAIKSGHPDLLELKLRSEPAAPGLTDLSDLNVAPSPVHQVRPEFPDHLLVAPLSAEILVGFIVDTSGLVSHAYAIRSSNPWFERGTVEAVKQWRFKPGEVGGRVVNTRMQVPITYKAQPEGPTAWTLRVLTDASKLPANLTYDVAPSVRGTTFAAYPFEALRQGRRDRLSARALVDTRGAIANVAFDGTPDPAFAGAVTAMLADWRFKPATLRGQPTATVVFLQFAFDPKGPSCAPVPPAAQTILKELQREQPRIYSLSDLDHRPQLVANRLPVHPPALHAAGQGGEALVEFFIDETGGVQLPHVVEATHPEFGYAAVQAMTTWWFERPLRQGKPVTVRARVPIRFDVKSTPGP